MGSVLHVWQVVLFLFLGASLVAVLFTFPLWFVCKKAGFSPWLTLLNCIPMGTPVLLYLLAFAEWKRYPLIAEQPVRVSDPVQHAVGAKKPIPIRPSAR